MNIRNQSSAFNAQVVLIVINIFPCGFSNTTFAQEANVVTIDTWHVKNPRIPVYIHANPGIIFRN